MRLPDIDESERERRTWSDVSGITEVPDGHVAPFHSMSDSDPLSSLPEQPGSHVTFADAAGVPERLADVAGARASGVAAAGAAAAGAAAAGAAAAGAAAGDSDEHSAAGRNSHNSTTGDAASLNSRSFLSRAAKKTGKFMPGRSRLGTLVTMESMSWNFTRGLVEGIQKTVQKASTELQAAGGVIQPSDFAEYYKESLAENQDTRRFKDYAPKVFHELRNRFGVDDQSYLRSILHHGLSEISTSQTGSKSGQKFFVTADGRYFMKTITKSESKFFRKVLPQYYEHVKNSRNTLLCRFFGLHRIQPGNLHLLVMSNIFDTDRIIHQRYDLKGSTVGRKVSEAEKEQETVILKDLDFKANLGKITLGTERKALLMAQMQADTTFLRHIGVMDYSLLVGVHHRDKQPATPDTDITQQAKAQRRDHLVRTGSLIQRTAEKSHTSAFQEDDGGWCSLAVLGESQVSGREIYFVGIIDYLQYYNKRKRAETLIKGLQYKTSEISAVKPSLYKDRFIAFIDSILQ